MTARAAYEELRRRSRERATLASCSALLGWDEQTYMPRGGAAHRRTDVAERSLHRRIAKQSGGQQPAVGVEIRLGRAQVLEIQAHGAALGRNVGVAVRLAGACCRDDLCRSRPTVFEYEGRG